MRAKEAELPPGTVAEQAQWLYDHEFKKRDLREQPTIFAVELHHMNSDNTTSVKSFGKGSNLDKIGAERLASDIKGYAAYAEDTIKVVPVR